MAQVRFQPFGKDPRGNLHTTQHPFNDVAVVAQKPSAFAGVVAVVCSCLTPVKASVTNSALVVLNDEQSLNVLVGKSRSPLALRGQSSFMTLGVCSSERHKLFGSRLSFWCLRSFAAFGLRLRASVYLLATGLNIGSAVVLPAFSSLLFNIGEAANAVVFKMCRPLFGSAVTFGFASVFHVLLSVDKARVV